MKQGAKRCNGAVVVIGGDDTAGLDKDRHRSDIDFEYRAECISSRSRFVMLFFLEYCVPVLSHDVEATFVIYDFAPQYVQRCSSTKSMQ